MTKNSTGNNNDLTEDISNIDDIELDSDNEVVSDDDPLLEINKDDQKDIAEDEIGLDDNITFIDDDEISVEDLREDDDISDENGMNVEISEEDKKHINHPKSDQIHVVPNGVDFNHFSPKNTILKYDLVFVGNMGYAPNVDAAVFLCNDILPKIHKEIPNAKILIGNKIDLESRKVKREDAEQFASLHGFLYDEVSVKQDINVDESLLKLVQDTYKFKNVNKGFKSTELNYLALKPKSNTIKDRENCCCIC